MWAFIPSSSFNATLAVDKEIAEDGEKQWT